MTRREPYPGGSEPPTATPAGGGNPVRGASASTDPGNTPTDAPSAAQGSPAGAKDVADKAQEKVGQVADQAQEKVGQVADQAKQQATSRLESGREGAVDGLGSVAQAIRQTGQGLREQDQGTIGQYADQAAEQVERLASYLRQHDVGQLIDETERFARRRPGLFLGGGVALGLLVARFLKSSGERDQAKQRYYQSLETPAYDRAPGYAPGFQSSEMDRPAGGGPEMRSEYASGALGATPRAPGEYSPGTLGTTPDTTPSAPDLESRPGTAASPGLEE